MNIIYKNNATTNIDDLTDYMVYYVKEFLIGDDIYIGIRIEEDGYIFCMGKHEGVSDWFNKKELPKKVRVISGPDTDWNKVIANRI